MTKTRRGLLRALGSSSFLASAGVFAPSILFAQPIARVYRLAYLSPESEHTGRATFDAFRAGLRSLGYEEGRNTRIDARWAAGSDERLDAFAAELNQSKPDVMVTQTRAVFAARRAGVTVPVVFAFSGDPILAKLAETLARPGGNFSGLSMLSLELTAKRMELLKELLPGLKRVAVITNPGHAGEQAELRVSQSSANALGLSLDYFPVGSANELEPALEQIARLRCDAIVVFPDAGTMTYGGRIAEFTRKSRIPAISGWVPFAEQGNLMTYGPELRDAFRRLAGYVDRILKGAKPGELPIELPTRFELAVNLKTAQALNFRIPQSILLRADRVIE